MCKNRTITINGVDICKDIGYYDIESCIQKVVDAVCDPYFIPEYSKQFIAFNTHTFVINRGKPNVRYKMWLKIFEDYSIDVYTQEEGNDASKSMLFREKAGPTRYSAANEWRYKVASTIAKENNIPCLPCNF